MSPAVTRSRCSTCESRRYAELEAVGPGLPAVTGIEPQPVAPLPARVLRAGLSSVIEDSAVADSMQCWNGSALAIPRSGFRNRSQGDPSRVDDAGLPRAVNMCQVKCIRCEPTKRSTAASTGPARGGR
ncbi:hypothetical protein GCM10023222_56020 [Saccharopolyspora cebuensis]